MNPNFYTGLWITLGVLAAVAILSLLMTVFKKVA